MLAKTAAFTTSFEIVPAFCHSNGQICQGGFLTGMADTAAMNINAVSFAVTLFTLLTFLPLKAVGAELEKALVAVVDQNKH